MDYLMINNTKVDLTKEQVEAIKKSFGIGTTKLSEIAEGNTFKIGEHEFIVLEQGRDSTAVILKKPLRNSKFGNSNNFNDNSEVDKICSNFADDVVELIGKKNLIEHTVDLTADDGLKCYGKVKRRASLITTNQYRRYVEIFDKHKLDCWWWTATAYSTPKHGYSETVKCVSPSGCIDDGNCNYYNIGVRPFCIFNNSIFVSE